MKDCVGRTLVEMEVVEIVVVVLEVTVASVFVTVVVKFCQLQLLSQSYKCLPVVTGVVVEVTVEVFAFAVRVIVNQARVQVADVLMVTGTAVSVVVDLLRNVSSVRK